MALFLNGKEVLSSIVMHGTWTALGTVTLPGVTFSGGIVIGDDILLALGAGSDQVMLNRSGTLNANTALTGVLIGTPVTPALAANSLIIANATANGDILIAVNDGGHSQGLIFIDGDVKTLNFPLGFTLGGAVNVNGQALTSAYQIAAYDGNTILDIHGGSTVVGRGAKIRLGAHAYGVPSVLTLSTSNVAGDADVDRLSFSGALATAVATWSNVTHTGIVLSGTLTLNGQVFDAGAGQAVINTTGANVGQKIAGSHSVHGPALMIAHAHTTPDAGTNLGYIYFEGYDGAGTPVAQNLGVLSVRYVNVTDTTEETRMVWDLWTGGATNEAMTLSGAGALWTDLSVDTLTYKVSGTQVVGARVVDARCDDAINTGDATSDGVIDSLRDAMIAHGLIAAA